MGTTILGIEKGEEHQVITRFSSRRRGARRWRFLVDEWGELLEKHADSLKEEVDAPDNPRSLGCGARRVCSIEVCTLAFAEYRRTPDAKKALKNNELLFDIHPTVLKMMRQAIPRLKDRKRGSK